MDGTNTAENQTFDAAELGAMMREMRENLGHELADVATDLRIRLVYLEAIEAGRLADLPGSAYASGFLRAYSDYLGLDGDEIVRRFRMAGVAMSNQIQLHLPSPVEEGRLPTGPILLLAAIVAGAVYGGWYFFSSSGSGPVSSVAELPSELSRLIENRGDETPAPDAVSPSVSTPTMTVERPTLPDSAVGVPAPAVPPPATESASAATESDAPAPAAAAGDADTASDAGSPAAPSASAIPGTPEPASEPVAMPREAETATPQQATLPAQADAARDPAPVPDSPESNGADAESSAASAVTPTAPASAEPPPQAAAETPVTREPAPATAEPAFGSTPEFSPVSRPEAASPATAAASQLVPEASPQVAAASDPRRIVVRATADSFVAVLTSDNQPLFSQLMRPGDSYEVPSGADLVLETGNAGGLEISVGDRTAPPLGPIGSIRRNVPLDAEKLLQGSY